MVCDQLYRAQKLITGWTLDTHLNTVTRLLLFLINIVPMTIALLLWQRMLEERIADPFAQLFGMALLSGGTMLSRSWLCSTITRWQPPRS